MTNSPIESLVRAQCTKLNISKADLVKRMGYANVSKGLRRLDDLLHIPTVKTDRYLEPLANALELPHSVVLETVEQTKQKLAAAQDAKWRSQFKPHAVIETGEGGRPKQLGIAALVGAMNWVIINFEPQLTEDDYLPMALSEFTTRKNRIYSLFYPAESIAINISPDLCLRYSLSGDLIERLDRAVRVGHLSLRV